MLKTNKKCIIKPFLEFIRKMLVEYNDENALENHLNDSIKKIKSKMENLTMSVQIIASVKNNELGPKLLQFIAPYFHITKVVLKDEKSDKDECNYNTEEISTNDKDE